MQAMDGWGETHCTLHTHTHIQGGREEQRAARATCGEGDQGPTRRTTRGNTHRHTQSQQQHTVHRSTSTGG